MLWLLDMWCGRSLGQLSKRKNDFGAALVLKKWKSQPLQDQHFPRMRRLIKQTNYLQQSVYNFRRLIKAFLVHVKVVIASLNGALCKMARTPHCPMDPFWSTMLWHRVRIPTEQNIFARLFCFKYMLNLSLNCEKNESKTKRDGVGPYFKIGLVISFHWLWLWFRLYLQRMHSTVTNCQAFNEIRNNKTIFEILVFLVKLNRAKLNQAM